MNVSQFITISSLFMTQYHRNNASPQKFNRREVQRMLFDQEFVLPIINENCNDFFYSIFRKEHFSVNLIVDR